MASDSLDRAEVGALMAQKKTLQLKGNALSSVSLGSRTDPGEAGLWFTVTTNYSDCQPIYSRAIVPVLDNQASYLEVDYDPEIHLLSMAP